MKNEEKIIVTSRTLAQVLGVDPSTIRKLTAGMVLTKAGRGTYELEKAVQQFIAYQVGLVKKNLGTSKADEDTRLTRAKANLAEIDLERARGELVPLPEALKILGHLVSAAKISFLALPSKVKSKYPDLSLELMGHIETEIRETLQDLSTRELPEEWRVKH